MKPVLGRLRWIAIATRLGLLLSGMALALPAGPALGAQSSARLNININLQGFSAITSLAAQTGASPGSISLSWTEPAKNGVISPSFYEMRISSSGQISSTPEFEAAAPLSALSGSQLPTPGGGGGYAAFVVTGLTSGVTYYFALRESDSGTPALKGSWLRDVSRAININNFAVASAGAGGPLAITDLTALTGASEGQVSLAWTAPASSNLVPISSYTVHFATFSPAAVGGDPNVWFALTVSSSRVLSPAHAAGVREALVISGLDPGQLFFFAVKSTDTLGATGPVDAGAGGVSARAMGIQGITSLLAQAGASPGTVDLAWTQPFRAQTTLPERYVVKASSVANIADDAGFAAAQPLTAFSPSPVPSVGIASSSAGFTVTGLAPSTTYYFAVRAEDSSIPSLVGHWLRDAASGRNLNNFATATASTSPASVISDLSALPGSAEGQINLSWTAPTGPGGVAVSSYVVRFASFSVASLGGDTTAWFNLTAASSAILAPAHAPGVKENLTLSGLYPGTTFYFGAKFIDVTGQVSAIDTRASTAGQQAFSLPKDLPPPTPAGLAASGGRNKVSLRWNALPAGSGDLNFSVFFLQRSTLPASNFVETATTTALSFVDNPLGPLTTYYYRIGARDVSGLTSVLSSTVSAFTIGLPPLEPLGLQLVASSSYSVTIAWSSTTRFGDGSLFDSPRFTAGGGPTTDELIGYTISRSTGFCVSPSTTVLAGVGVSSYTDAATGGLPYFYRVQSYNSVGFSTPTLYLSSLGEEDYLAEDCASRAVLDPSQVSVLAAGYSEPVQILRRLRPEDLPDAVNPGRKIVQSTEFRAFLGGHTEIKNFAFPKPVSFVLHFVTDGVNPVPAGLGAAAAPSSAKNLGMFWNNGLEYVKLYGAVDLNGQVVTAQTPNLGAFQLRTLLRDSGVTFDLSNITSRIFTPNGDGRNDVVIFSFDNPNGSNVEGKIYDIRGAYVATMAPGPQPNSLMWDGKMDGRVVSSGVYVYQIQGEGKTFNGTVVVAR